MQANVDGAWLIARAAGRAHDRARARRQGRLHVLGARQARAPGRLFGLLHVEVGDRRHDQGARLRVGQARHHRQRARAHGVSQPADGVDVRDDEKARNVRAGFLARVPIGRLGEPEDLAGPLLFLCSRASDFHTGHIVYADGGYTAG